MSIESNGAAPAAEASITNSPETENTETEGSESEGSENQEAALEAVATDPLATKAEKKAAEKQLKKYKLKIDGKEEDFELDLNDDESIKKHLQMSKASQRKMQESAELKKAAEEFIHMLKTNPRKVLSDPSIGVDLKKLAQDYINEEIEAAALSPEERKIQELQKELEEHRSKGKKAEEDRKRAELEKLQNEEADKINTNIQSALETGNIPKTPYTVRKMAELMMSALENDIELSPKDLVPILRNQLQADIKDFFGAAPDDVLEEFIGKDRMSNMRKQKVAKVKQQVAQTANAVKPTGAGTKIAEAATKKINMKDFLS